MLHMLRVVQRNRSKTAEQHMIFCERATLTHHISDYFVRALRLFTPGITLMAQKATRCTCSGMLPGSPRQHLSFLSNRRASGTLP